MLVPMCTVPESIVPGNICNAKDQGTFNVPLQRDHLANLTHIVRRPSLLDSS
jgi:hypothetical protein